MARQNIFGTVFGVDAGMMQLAVFPNMSKRRAGEIVDRIFNFYHNKDVRLVMPASTPNVVPKIFCLAIFMLSVGRIFL